MNCSPCRIEYGSFLLYSSKGTDEVSQNSKSLCMGVKKDKSTRDGRNIINAITADMPRLLSGTCLKDFFDPEAILIPTPRSSVLQPDSLWPAHRICEGMVASGLGARIWPVISRHTAVRKSAFSAANERPTPEDHLASTRLVKPLEPDPEQIIVIDDVVTRGSIFVGITPHLRQAFPLSRIKYFALFRTYSRGEIPSLVTPTLDYITFNSVYGYKHPSRRPFDE